MTGYWNFDSLLAQEAPEAARSPLQAVDISTKLAGKGPQKGSSYWDSIRPILLCPHTLLDWAPWITAGLQLLAKNVRCPQEASRAGRPRRRKDS